MPSKNFKISIFSHFFIAVLLDGLQRMSGLFMRELVQTMNMDRQNAALPFTLSWAVANIVSSFSDGLLRKNSKYVKLIGVLLTATGAALCMFTTNIFVLIVCWGFIFGSGYGLSSPHFSRHLRNVNCNKLSFLLHATPCMGAAIMPFILHMLISYYGLAGSYLLLSGIILNYIPLNLATAYNIELSLPNIKWRVRKRSSQYYVSKQDQGKAVSNESFINSFEPDLILKISQSGGFEDQIHSYREHSDIYAQEVMCTGRKRSDTKGNDLQGLPIDNRILPKNKTHSQMVVEIQNYETVRELFEGSFSNNETIYEELENDELRQCYLHYISQNYDGINTNNEVVKNDLTNIVHATDTATSSTNLKFEVSEQHSEYLAQERGATFMKNILEPTVSNNNIDNNQLPNLEYGNEQNTDAILTDNKEEKNILNIEAAETADATITVTLIDEFSNKDEEESHFCSAQHNIGEIFIENNFENTMLSTHTSVETTHTLSLTNEISEKCIECQLQCTYNCSADIEDTNTSIEAGSETSKEIRQIPNQTSNAHKIMRTKSLECEKEKTTKDTKKISPITSNLDKIDNNQILDSREEDNISHSSKCLENKTVFDIPLDIKVHVIECTLMGDEEKWFQHFDNKYLKPQKKSYRKHSNSLMPGTYDNIDFSTLSCPQKYAKCSDLGKPKLSNVYSISEKIDLNISTLSLQGTKQKKTRLNSTLSKMKPFLKFFYETTTPICLCIILITMIFEINFITLITICADFGNDVDDECSDFKWILVAFGIGGLIGKFCCCKISRTIPEKSNAIGVVLFLLTGLSIAGILFSPNLNWLAGFYCILGALEGGISYTIPKFILENIDRDMHSKVLASKSFLSGIAIMSIPYLIGLSRDQLGDYEFLLQTLSCSSVLCAFLVYFLPYLSKSLDHRNNYTA